MSKLIEAKRVLYAALLDKIAENGHEAMTKAEVEIAYWLAMDADIQAILQRAGGA